MEFLKTRLKFYSFIMKNAFPLFLSAIAMWFVGCNNQNNVPDNIPQNTMFELLPAAQTGVDFANMVNDSGETNIYNTVYIYNGGGVAAGDINNDGLTDVFFTANQEKSRLYLNQGDFKFKDITEEAGIDDTPGWSTGVTMADVNGDGLLDIYICKGGSKVSPNRSNLLYINEGNLKFSEQGATYGLNSSATSTHATFFDYDADGDLDMYLVNHPENFDLIMDFNYYYFDPTVDTVNSNRLFENDGNTFRDVSESAGLGYEKGFGLSVSTGDIDNDGDQDIFVANDFLSPDYLYLNNGDKTFTEARQNHFDYLSMFSMGSDFGDLNNDGKLDLMVVDMEPEDHFRRKNNDITFPFEFYNMQEEFLNARQFSHNMLQIGNGDGTFSEIAEFAEVARTDWSWSVLFGDLDNDGFDDIFVTNGTQRELNDKDYMLSAFDNQQLSYSENKPNSVELIRNLPSTKFTNYIFQNNEQLQFYKMMQPWGFEQKVNSSGAAYADLNNDGFLDIIVNNSDTTSFIYKNTGKSPKPTGYLRVKLKGPQGNSFGIGARVSVYFGPLKKIQEMDNARGFQSSSEPILHFGLRNTPKLDSLVVEWPGDKRQILTDVPINQVLTLSEAEATSFERGEKYPPAEKPFFANVRTGRVKHKEKNFEDFKRDKMLPHQLSRLGPCLAVGDVNGDGMEDYYLGGAHGQSGTLFVQNNAGFLSSNSKVFQPDSLSEDIAALFFDMDGDGDLDLYVASGSNEFYPDHPNQQDHLYINNGNGNFSNATDRLPIMLTSTGSVSAADFDGDGDLDLAVGGRLVPTDYGQPARSYLLKNEGNAFVDITNDFAPALFKAGMVSAVEWADVDGDEDPDLLLAGEFLRFTLLKNEAGRLVDKTIDAGFEGTEGWWNCLKSADFDGDGDIDFVAGNYGFNSIFKASIEEPVKLYSGDFDQSGANDPIIFHHLLHQLGPFPDRDQFCKQMPDFFNKFHTYGSFATAELKDIFTEEQIKTATKRVANTFASSYLENQGDGTFTVTPLPRMAQLSPIHDFVIEDFNGDGNLDLLAGGNSYSHFYDRGPQAASRGVFLWGNGKGQFEPEFRDQPWFSLDGDLKSLAWVKGKGSVKYLVAGRSNGYSEVWKWIQ